MYKICWCMVNFEVQYKAINVKTINIHMWNLVLSDQ
jgi:hypothetical protein